MRRRRFLQLSALGLSASLIGTAGVMGFVQPRRHRLRPRAADDEARPERAKSRKRVLVVGGGLGGLAAATELAGRNFEVTLLEQASHLGGKLGGWTVNALGESFPIEHGFHGFFSQYYNLAELLGAASATSDLAESPGYPILFGDRPPELFGRTTRLFPFNLLSVVQKSNSLRLGDFATDGPGLLELMRYDGAHTFARWDDTDFSTFVKEGGIHRQMVETVLAPFGKTTLNRLDRLSAAEAIRFFHFYFMGNPEGLAFRFLTRDSMTAVVEPLRRRLESLGGRVRRGTRVERLLLKEGCVEKIELGSAADAREKLLFDPAKVPPEGFLPLPRSDGSSVFVARRGGTLVALDGRCTHMGCPIAVDQEGRGFRCPCHGGTFDGEGRPTGGPPLVALDRLVVSSGPDGLAVARSASSTGRETLACDYCVLACEVRGLQSLVARSNLPPDLVARVQSLGEADPYVVWRLWLDRPVRASRSPFYTTSRFIYTDSLAVYSHFQEPYRGWAHRTGGAVVEVHAYAIPPDRLRSAEEIRRTMWKELLSMLPELEGAKLLHDEYQQQSNFSRFAPGDDARRPGTETAVQNLLLAGDHVRLPVPAALMEAAVISGRMAANAILHRERLKEVPIWTVAPQGPLIF